MIDHACRLPRGSSPRTRGDGPGTLHLLALPVPFSPHTRGWPGSPRRDGRSGARSPRTRGDGPKCSYHDAPLIEFSPHTRGWPGTGWRQGAGWRRSPRTRGDGPETIVDDNGIEIVLPAHAGMARGSESRFQPSTGSPRTRGDGPTGQDFGQVERWFSPHTRGWPAQGWGESRFGCAVLPAHAGMARRTCLDPFSRHGVLPAHAGMARVSKASAAAGPAFSPHTRGWPGRT